MALIQMQRQFINGSRQSIILIDIDEFEFHPVQLPSLIYNLLTFQRAFCAFCHDRIWGLGRQGFKCTQCKLLVHKKCHKLGSKSCTKEQVEPISSERGSHNGLGNDHQSTENVPQISDYPPEIPEHGK